MNLDILIQKNSENKIHKIYSHSCNSNFQDRCYLHKDINLQELPQLMHPQGDCHITWSSIKAYLIALSWTWLIFATKYPLPLLVATVLWIQIRETTSPLFSDNVLRTKLNQSLGAEYITQAKPISILHPPAHGAWLRA